MFAMSTTCGQHLRQEKITAAGMQSKMKTARFLAQVSNEKNLGWLGYIGDYIILPSYIGIIRDYNKP